MSNPSGDGGRNDGPGRLRPSPEDRLSDALGLLKAWIWETDADLRFTYLSEGVREHAGREPSWHYGKTRDEVGAVDSSSELFRQQLAQLTNLESFGPYEFGRQDADRAFWWRTVGRPLFDADGRFLGYRGLAYDVTAERQAEEKLANTRRFLDSILEHAPVAILVKDPATRKTILVNQAYEALAGMAREDILGKTVFDIFDPHTAELFDRFDSEVLEASSKLVMRDLAFRIPGQPDRIVTSTRLVVRDDAGKPEYLIVTIEDITEQRRSEQHIAFMAHHDALTGLANRASLVEKIEEARARLDRHGEAFSVLLLDLDRFKEVNDTFGHFTGDQLLQETAQRLKSLLRDTDVLARLGGDEFAVIQAGETEPREAAAALATRIVEAVGAPLHLEGRMINIGTSVGIACAPEHGSEPGELMKMADLALYRTKAQGRNGYSFYSADLSAAASARQRIESELRRAIAENELELHYQPIVESKSSRICGVEALVRWRHPTRGLIYPDQFIRLAEETGLINSVGEWVLAHACADAAAWPADIKLSINLSPKQFARQNLTDVLICALAESGLPPERLELEITETALLGKGTEYLPTLRQFKNIGVSIALDDFGTGYSSLSQLTMFPFDRIKIDRSFTQNLTRRADCAAIVSAVLTLAHSLDIATTAEGVETDEQFQLLRLARVSALQGYLFGRPCPASELDFAQVYMTRLIGDVA